MDDLVRFHTSDSLREAIQRGRTLPSALRMLGNFSSAEIHIMPDFSPDLPGLLPVGLVFSTDGMLVPQAVPDVGCGYRLLRLPIQFSALTPPVIKKMMSALQRLKTREPIQNLKIDEIFIKGIRALHQAGFVSGPDVDEDIADPEAIPEIAMNLAHQEFARHGGYGHFVELLRVARIVTPANNIQENDVLLLIHSGSERVGFESFLYYYQLAGNNSVKSPYFSAEELDGQKYLKAVGALTNYAKARREILSVTIASDLGAVIGNNHPWNFVSDVPHVSITQTSSGTFTHARGTQRLPAGVIGIICGDVGTPSYLVRTRSDTSVLVCHGRTTCRINSALDTNDLELLKMSKSVLCNRKDATRKVNLNMWQHQAMRGVKEAINSSLAEVDVIAVLNPIINFRGNPKDH